MAARSADVAIVDAKLIENLHVEGARRMLLLANSIRELEKDAAN